MSVKNIILKNRSYRRFDQNVPLSMELLREMVDAARLSPSARNMQPLKYMLFNDQDSCERIFPTLAWAGYMKDWDGPREGERPAAYIIQLADLDLAEQWWCDDGIAIQSMLLTAVESGFGGCIIASVQREKLRAELEISDRYKIIQVLALGKPAEKVILDTLPTEAEGGDGQNADIRYWRADDDGHHVPKRPLDELIIP